MLEKKKKKANRKQREKSEADIREQVVARASAQACSSVECVVRNIEV